MTHATRTYTLTTDHPRFGRAGATVEMPPAAAKYLVLNGTLSEGTPPPRKAAASKPSATKTSGKADT